MYDEDYGEAGVSAGENGALVLGCENDWSKLGVVITSGQITFRGGSYQSDYIFNRAIQPTLDSTIKKDRIRRSDLFSVHRGGAIGYNGLTPMSLSRYNQIKPYIRRWNMDFVL